MVMETFSYSSKLFHEGILYGIKKLFFHYFYPLFSQMRNQQLIEASKSGDINLVKSLLESEEVQINYQNIQCLKSFVKSKSIFLNAIANLCNLWNSNETR